MNIIIPSIWLCAAIFYASMAIADGIPFFILSILIIGTAFISFYFGVSHD
jgi:hypothetical protein